MNKEFKTSCPKCDRTYYFNGQPKESFCKGCGTWYVPQHYWKTKEAPYVPKRLQKFAPMIQKKVSDFKL